MEHVPELYSRFKQRFPGIQDAYHELSKQIYEYGPLEEKTGHLIKLGVSVALNSEGAVRSHVRRSLQAGATSEEIIQAVLFAFTTCGYPYTATALGWVEEVLVKEKINQK